MLKEERLGMESNLKTYIFMIAITLVSSLLLSYSYSALKDRTDKNIEFESVSKLITKPLKEKLKAQATELNYLKRTSRSKLPI